MQQKQKTKQKKSAASQTTQQKKVEPQLQKNRVEEKASLIPWLLGILAVTAICFIPMLKNEFTNWDDEYYVINNMLLRGPDWKGIFTTPVVSNYHPLTILSLAFNYQLSELDPTSYLVTNLLLHLANTALVFYFILMISDRKIWVACITALLFGIHPLHVESVAWVSERKDVLYTFFFMLALIQYWRFLESSKQTKLWLCFLLFAFSLLSKPAAIILPLVLLLLDYWKGRKFSLKLLTEKIPFFILALFFAILTVKIQSEQAIAGLDLYPLWTRPLFATYVIMIYFVRFFVPHPLSAFHPYPFPHDLGLAVWLSPLFIIALIVFLWYQRKNKPVVFGILFFIVNLLLILQIVSIGTTIVSERYTYVPYIGLAFGIGSIIQDNTSVFRSLKWVLPAIVVMAFGTLTYRQTQVWKNSATLWQDAIDHYPEAPQPRTNRANYILKLDGTPEEKEAYMRQALEDCNISLKTNPNHAAGYENREFIYFKMGRYEEAVSDAHHLIRLQPDNPLGYAVRGASYVHLNKSDSALQDLNKSLTLNPDNEFALDNRGSLLYNSFQDYEGAIADFTKAISLNPLGSYYLNRSYSNYRLGNTDKAKADAQIALQKGMSLPDNYKQGLGL